MAGSTENLKRQPELNTAEKLEAKIKKMANFWKAGFGGKVSVMASSAKTYADYHEIELKKYHLHSLQLIEGVYEGIPFSTLDKDAKEFKPIFEVNTLIPAMREDVQTLHEDPNYQTARKIFLTGKHIVNLGRLYDKYIQDSISQLRKIEGYENYNIEVEHIEKPPEEIIKKRGHLRRIWREDVSRGNIYDFEDAVLKSRRELQEYISGMKAKKSGEAKNRI